ncbi:LysM peptidoglycan-binding domain-containing protein [Patescibacteria group bacterium]|nr:LysM peptidoglycan-binding domain-containing protein [Patescibacteria group bacterium]MBU1758040.1 LysM peptidoglycan-binding domain-containing protein [Patescibacteria group bacterium]
MASIFGSTVGHITEVNHIKGPIRPGNVLVITDEEKGFVYELPEKTNIVVFANKYNLNLEDLMTLNYIQDETEILFEGSEIFINITDEQAISK